MRPEARLEEAGYGAPQEAGQDAGPQDQDDGERTEEAEGHPEPGRGDGADEELSLAPDVEQAGAEGHGHGEAREDQGRRAEKRQADGGRGADRAPHERRVGRQGVVAGRQHDHGPYEEGDEDGEEGEDQSPSGVHEGPAQRRAAGRPFVLPPGVLSSLIGLTRSAPPRARP